MKTLTYITIFTSIIFLSSCRLHRERQTNLQAEEEKHEYHTLHSQGYRSSTLDSNQHHWSIWTDGWLYYHPDSGLRAQGALFELYESRRRAQHTEQLKEDLSQKNIKKQQALVEEKFTSEYKTSIWTSLYLIIILILIYCIYRYFWRLKF